MKNKKITLLCMSFLTTLGLVSCGATDSKVETEYPVETFIQEDVVSHGMQINRLASGVDANENEYQTFSFVVLPSTSVHKDCSASISFADNRQNGSSYLIATVDNYNQTCTITMLDFFDSVATLRLQNNYYSNVYAEVTIRLNPRYLFEMNSFTVEQLYTSSGNASKLFTYFEQNISVVMEDNTEVQVNPYSNISIDSYAIEDGLTVPTIGGLAWPSNGSSEACFSQPCNLQDYANAILHDLVLEIISTNRSFCFSSVSELASYLSDIKQLYRNNEVNYSQHPEWQYLNVQNYASALNNILSSRSRTISGASYGYFIGFTFDFSYLKPLFSSDHALYSFAQDCVISGTATCYFEMFQDVQSMSVESATITF